MDTTLFFFPLHKAIWSRIQTINQLVIQQKSRVSGMPCWAASKTLSYGLYATLVWEVSKCTDSQGLEGMPEVLLSRQFYNRFPIKYVDIMVIWNSSHNRSISTLNLRLFLYILGKLARGTVQLTGLTASVAGILHLVLVFWFFMELWLFLRNECEWGYWFCITNSYTIHPITLRICCITQYYYASPLGCGFPHISKWISAGSKKLISTTKSACLWWIAAILMVLTQGFYIPSH